MFTPSRQSLLCRYYYDPLDRLANFTPSAASDAQRFYCRDRLATEVFGGMNTSFFQDNEQLMAQRQSRNSQMLTTLLATDLQRSVLNVVDAAQTNLLAYTPYGHRPAQIGLLSLLGFNGEQPDPTTGHYHLGNGYRQFNPVLMRFNSPDAWCPFGKGGLNAYAYCDGEPVNRRDPTGHTWLPIKTFLRKIGVMKKSVKTPKTVSIGAWQLDPNSGMVHLPSRTPSKKSTKHLTRKEEKQFHREFERAAAEGQATDKRLQLTEATTRTAPQTSSAGSSNNNSSESLLANSIEYMPAAELTSFRNKVSGWTDVGSEKATALRLIDNENELRSLNFHGNPPRSNRNIRRGEPGYIKN